MSQNPIASDTLVSLNNLSFGYSKDKLLLKEFSFELKRGSLIAIVGKSGAGKSTLFELILKNLQPLHGSVTTSSKIAQVFQDPYTSFHPSYTLLNQISDVASLENVEEYLEVMQLEFNILKKLPHELSGGQLQRASIVRALLMQPDILLLDEPTSALDNIIQLEVMQLLVKKLPKIGTLLITHDSALALWCADEIITL